MSEPAAPLPSGELTFDFGGKTYTLVLDWAAIAWFERESGASLLDLYAGIAAGNPKLSLFAFLLQAGLQRHHPEVDLNQAGQMSLNDDVRRALDLATGEAMPAVDPDQSAEGNAAAG